MTRHCTSRKGGLTSHPLSNTICCLLVSTARLWPRTPIEFGYSVFGLLQPALHAHLHALAYIQNITTRDEKLAFATDGHGLPSVCTVRHNYPKLTTSVAPRQLFLHQMTQDKTPAREISTCVENMPFLRAPAANHLHMLVVPDYITQSAQRRCDGFRRQPQVYLHREVLLEVGIRIGACDISIAGRCRCSCLTYTPTQSQPAPRYREVQRRHWTKLKKVGSPCAGGRQISIAKKFHAIRSKA